MSELGGYRIVSAAVDPASINGGAAGTGTATISEGGLQTSMNVVAIPPSDLEAGLVPMGAVVATGTTITVRLYNPTGGAVDGASKTWYFIVFTGESNIGWAG